jgi:hypothetical protein
VEEKPAPLPITRNPVQVSNPLKPGRTINQSCLASSNEIDQWKLATDPHTTIEYRWNVTQNTYHWDDPFVELDNSVPCNSVI